MMDSMHSCESLAERLVGPLWRGLDPDYKAKYARNIWDQFEGQIRSASYTAQLTRFLQRVTTRLPIEVRGADAESVAEVIGDGDDRMVLKMLREEAAYIVLLVRVANEERREAAGRSRGT